MKSRSFFSNVTMNIIANVIVLGVIQIIIFPIISQNFGAVKFGEVVSLYGISNVITDSLGGSLSSIRLILNKKISERGNFAYLFRIILVLVFLSILILIQLYAIESSLIEKIFLVLFTMIAFIRIYLTTTFQIEFEYKKVVISKIILTIGYIAGLLLTPIFKSWSIIFLLGELLTFIYLFKTTTYLKEPPEKNQDYKKVTTEYNYLVVSKILSSSLNHLDRFLLPPILGASTLSIYYASSVVSKVISLLVTPMTNVLLSYLNKYNFKNKKKSIIVSSVITSLLLIPVYIIIVWISPYAIRVLYPQFQEKAIELVWLTALVTCFSVLYGITNTFILANNEMKDQTYINIVFLFIYLLSSLFLANKFGIFGYAYASVFSYFLRWIVSLVVGIRGKNRYK